MKKIIFTSAAKSAGKKDLKFVYDPMDMRVAKIVYNNAAHSDLAYTYYSYDAQGNVMATYEREQNTTTGDKLYLTEIRYTGQAVWAWRTSTCSWRKEPCRALTVVVL